MPTLSVVVPVYNVEKYIQSCIESILEQDYQDFELILVNDGSSDTSGDICDAYAEKDRRITVIHKENAGVSIARNTGIDAARGEYLTFIDSDDTIEQGMFRYLFNSLEISGNADCICSGIRFCYNDNSLNKSFGFPGIGIVSKPCLNSNYSVLCKNFAFSAIYAKLYKLGIINSKNIRFQEEYSILEDGMFISDYFKHAKSIYFADCIFYNYRQSDSFSLMKKFNANADFALALYYKKEAWLREYLHDEALKYYYKTRFSRFCSFITQIYTRSNFSKNDKRLLLKRYCRHEEIQEIINNVDIGINNNFHNSIIYYAVRLRMLKFLHFALLLYYGKKG